MEAAAAECAELLRTDPANAAAHCLLGVVHQAQGDAAAAERCFQRALYLEPSLHEALVHLALLAERRGQAQQAANYRRRAAKCIEPPSLLGVDGVPRRTWRCCPWQRVVRAEQARRLNE